MKKLSSFLLVFISLIGVNSFAQVTSVPEEAKANFAKQYPGAQNVKWDNDIVNVNVRFELDGEQMNAEYNNKGIWRNTVQDFSFDKLPEEVVDGFKKSKYADRTVDEVKLVYYPGEVKRFRLKAEKNDLQKKYLYFNEKGRLMRESNTL
jgi:hypothetical protein